MATDIYNFAYLTLNGKTEADLDKAAAAERGWSFIEPIDVTSSIEDGDPVWIINSNYMSRGQNVIVVLRQSDHSRMRAAFRHR